MTAMVSVSELSDRARDVFRLVVEGYLDTGVPVGSRTLSKLGLNLSPASIRNVMADLEDAGLLAAPHTSAGRMPTDIGLRLFVDGIMQAAAPTAAERAAIARELRGHGPVEDVVSAATATLSGLARCAGLVMVPRRELVLRQMGFMPLSQDQALAIIVGEDGTVENRVVTLPPGTDASALAAAGNYLTERLAGRTMAEARVELDRDLAADRRALDASARDLVERGVALWSEDGERRPVLIVTGQARLIDDGAAADLERVRLLLDELEGKAEIARLLDRARDGRATRIFIGSENELFALSGSSVIAAPYRGADGRVVGVVGVIGPTRLNYARVVPMVDFTARSLSRLMG